MFKKNFIAYVKDSGGRVLILFLLFILAFYGFYSAGFNNFAIVCSMPLLVLMTWISFRQKLTLFGILFVVNYCIMGAMRYNITLPGPVSLSSEILELLILSTLIIHHQSSNFSNLVNIMLLALLIWLGLVCIEAFNDTCGLGFNFYDWFREARLSSLQLIYIYVIFSLLICNFKKIKLFIYAWAWASIIAVFWAWRQKVFGFDHYEMAWLWSYGMRTHFVNGIIRYFSFFTDAANFGCNMAASSVVFTILGITSRLKRDKVFFTLTGLFCLYGMFTSGTRTAIICYFATLLLYVLLSKSIKIAIPISALGLIFLFLLAFTKIGQGNDMIRRMRTAFDPNDASKNVRDVNKESIAKYIDEAPWGIGIGMDVTKIPASNKYNIVSSIPPDSTYVYTWVHYGIIGVVIYAIMNILILIGGCYIVLFKIKSPVLRGIGAAFCCGFTGINIGAYANQIMPQYPNALLFYGSMAITYLLPKIEPEYIEFEKKDNQRLLEIKKKKEEEKNASRV